MTDTINFTEMKEELVVFIRNQDVMTITERNVTTNTQNDVLSAANDLTIPLTNIKNIRSITIDGTPLKYGIDYNTDYATTGTVISFINPQTGNSEVIYDYGDDRIFGDLPKTTLKIDTHFPRIGVDFVGSSTSEMGIGGYSNSTDVSLSIYIYAKKTRELDAMMDSIRRAIIQNKKNFYYFSFVTLAAVGPTLVFIEGNKKIYQRNIDIISPYNIEEV